MRRPPPPAALASLAETGDAAAACAAAAAALGLPDPRADFRLRARDPRQDMQYGESLRLVAEPAPYRRARLVFSRARRRWPGCAGAWLAAGAVETALARFAAALPLLARAARLAPGSAWVPAWRGVARSLDARRRRADDLRGALADLDRALARGASPGFVAPWRAELRHDLDDREGALADLARIPSGDDSFLWARVERGEILCECGRVGDALAEFDRLIAENPRASWAWALRGRTLATAGRAADGLRDLDRAVRLAPGSAAARAWRSEALRRLGRYAGALADLDRAVLLDPRYTLGWVWRGRLKLLLGRPAGALKDLDKAVRLDRRYRLGLAWRGEALFKLGRTRAAARDFARVAPLDLRRSWTPAVGEGARADADARARAYRADLEKRAALNPRDRWARRLLDEALRLERSERGDAMKTGKCDVLVIGGGPAGSTLAAILKIYAPERRVVLLERAPGPRHHVGESLLPGMVPVLKELGVFDAIDRAGFPRKLGATYVWGRDRVPWENDFNDVNMTELIARYGGIPEKIEYAWQVRRSEYDEILLANASAKGVEVVRGVQADGIVEENGRVAGATGRFEDGSRARWRAEFTADCTGQAAFLARYRPVRVYDPRLKNVSAYSYFRGAPWMFKYTGHPDKTKIFIASTAGGWFWYIPLGADLVSIGFVTTVETLKASGGDLRALYDRELAACPEIAPLLAKAERVRGVDGEDRDFFTHSDWSYLPVESSGPGWVACGDAAVFVDPILSSGVTLAHLSGHRAAYTMLEHWRRAPAERELLWADYGTYCRDIAGQYLALALFWYGNDKNAEHWWIEARRLQQAILPVDLADKGAFITVAAGLTQHYDRLFALRELAQEAATEPDEQPFFAMVMKGLEGRDVGLSLDETRPLRLVHPYRVEFAFLPDMGEGRLRAVKRARFLRGDPADAVENAFNPRKFVTRWHLTWLEGVDGRRDWGGVRAAAAAAGVPGWWLDGPARLFARDLSVQGVLTAQSPAETRA